VSRIEGCNLALVGTGEIRHPETGEVRQTMRWHKRIQFADELPAADGPTLRVVSGRALATAATDLLGATGQTLTIAEIERLLRLQGLLPGGARFIGHLECPARRGPGRARRTRPPWVLPAALNDRPTPARPYS